MPPFALFLLLFFYISINVYCILRIFIQNVNFLFFCQSMDMPIYEGDGGVNKG